MAKTPNRSVWPGVFDGAGYLLILVEWFVVGLLYLPALLESKSMQQLFPSSNEVKPTPVETSNAVEPSLLLTVSVAIFGILFIAFVVYIVVRKYVPAVVKTSAKIVDKTTVEVVHVRQKQQPRLTKKKTKLLTERISFWLKIALALLPAVVYLLADQDSGQLLAALAQFALSFSALLAVVAFVTARFFRRSRQRSDAP